MNVNTLAAIAAKSGFESYGNFRTEDTNIQCEILTCTKGDFSGENIEIYYDYYTGVIVRVSQYCQFPEVHPHYSPVKYDISLLNLNCPVS